MLQIYVQASANLDVWEIMKYAMQLRPSASARKALRGTEQVAVANQIKRMLVITSNVDDQADLMQKRRDEQNDLMPAVEPMFVLKLVKELAS